MANVTILCYNNHMDITSQNLKHNELSTYLRVSFGDRIDYHVLSVVFSDGLPRYLLDIYELEFGSLAGQEILAAFVRENVATDVIEVMRHQKILYEKFQRQPVFIYQELSSRTVQRLIRRHIPIIVVGREVYLPMLLVSIATRKPTPIHLATERLREWEEILLIRQLLRRDLNDLSGGQIADLFQTSPMNISRATNALCTHGFCRLISRGKRKHLLFDSHDKLCDLAWMKLSTPVIGTFHLSALPADTTAFAAGITALAKSSLLVDDPIPTVAIFARHFPGWKQAATQFADIESPKYKVEIWRRDPALTQLGGVVDPISLYLSVDINEPRVAQVAMDLLRRNGIEPPESEDD